MANLIVKDGAVTIKYVMAHGDGTDENPFVVHHALELYNGEGWDEQRNNVESILLASAARTVTTYSVDQVNHNHRGLIIVVDVSDITDTPNIRPFVQIKDSISGNYFTIWEASVSLSAVATSAYIFAIGVLFGGDYTEAANLLPGRTWRFGMDHDDEDSVTYSVSAVGLV